MLSSDWPYTGMKNKCCQFLLSKDVEIDKELFHYPLCFVSLANIIDVTFLSLFAALPTLRAPNAGIIQLCR